METDNSGVVIENGPGGNCPVQAEGTFDGVPFYFRARGSSVTVDVGEWVETKNHADHIKYVSKEWTWYGPEYEWPDAGWIMKETAVAFIHEAYQAWKGTHSEHEVKPTSVAEGKRRNDAQELGYQAWYFSSLLKKAMGDEGEAAAKWLFNWGCEKRKKAYEDE